jgi:hypothetical protein
VTASVKRTAEFDALIVQHGQAKTDREKAKLETQLWGMSTREERARVGRRNWLANLLGRSDKRDPVKSYELRGKLYNAPAALWDHMESASLSLFEANRLFDRCKAVQARANASFEMALKEVVEGDKDRQGDECVRSAGDRGGEGRPDESEHGEGEDGGAGKLEVPAGEAPAGRVSAGEAPVGTVPAEEASAEEDGGDGAGEVSVGEALAGKDPGEEVSGEKAVRMEAVVDPEKESASDPGEGIIREEALEESILARSVVKIPPVDELVLRHKQALTDREKSQIESMLWASLPQEKRRGHHARERRMRELLGGEHNPSPDSLYTYQTRAALSTAPAEMWDYIEKSLIPLGTALRLYRKCQIIQLRDKITFAMALQEALKQKPSDCHGAERLVMDDVSQMDEWDALWRAANAIGQARLGGLPDAIKRDMCGELRNQIRDVLCTFIAKAKRKSADEGEMTLIIRHQRMARACEILQIDVPSLGKPADLRAATNRKRAIAKFNHPDANGNGNSDTYQRAIEAYDHIQAYNEFIGQQAGKN